MIINNKHNPVKYVRCLCGHVSGLDSNQEGRQKYYCPNCGPLWAFQAMPISETEFKQEIKRKV